MLRSVGILPVVVHGGGPQIGALMKRLGKVPEFRDGLRVTDAETLEIARMVLVGKVNRDIVGMINVHAPLAVGLSGEDAGLITATARDPGLGYVGDVVAVDPSILHRLLAEGLVPVIATIGSDRAGQAYNINADTVAGAIAETLGAEKLVFLTDVEGIRTRPADATTLLHRLGADELDAMVASGAVAEGMVPKATACSHAVRHGVAGAHVLDGRVDPRDLARALDQRRCRHDGGGAVTAEPASPTLMPTYAPAPVRFVSGRGTELFDDEGRRYLDFLAGIAVVSLGHANERVGDAISRQAARLVHVSNLFHNELSERLARDLDRLVGDGTAAGGQVFFANSGAEANECAIKLARRVGGPGRHVVVSALGSFHGRTLATLAATGQPKKHEAFRPLPEGFTSVAYGDVGRTRGGDLLSVGHGRPPRGDPG